MCARLPQEYDGGTLMESILAVGTLPADFPRVIRAQREAVEAKIREMTNSDTIYPGLAAFREGSARRPGDIFAPVAPDSIPGVREAGWTPMPMRFRIVLPGCGDGTPTRANLHRFMRAIHTMVTEHADGWPFLEPVDGEEVTDYYEIVKEPIDLRLILERIEAGDYYITLEVRLRCVGALQWPVAATQTCVCVDFRCGLSAHVPELPSLQRPRHTLLQVLQSSGSLLRNQDRGEHQLEQAQRPSHSRRCRVHGSCVTGTQTRHAVVLCVLHRQRQSPAFRDGLHVAAVVARQLILRRQAQQRAQADVGQRSRLCTRRQRRRRPQPGSSLHSCV